MSRTLRSTTFTKCHDVTAKSLKKNDSLWVGKRSYRVASNKKNDYGQRVIRLVWGSNNKKDEVMLIVPKKALFHVQNSKTTREQ